MYQRKKLDETAMPQCKKVDLDMVRVEKYRATRYWSVWINGELLAVTVYKKGALAVKEIICTMLSGAE